MEQSTAEHPAGVLLHIPANACSLPTSVASAAGQCHLREPSSKPEQAEGHEEVGWETIKFEPGSASSLSYSWAQEGHVWAEVEICRIFKYLNSLWAPTGILGASRLHALAMHGGSQL